MIASAPKDGKSWFVLLLCLCVSMGKKFLGYDTHQCSVLYLALEDSDNRLRSRIKRIFDGEKLPNSFNYCTEIGDLSNGFIEQMEYIYKRLNNLRLIVVDTLQCIRGQYNNKDGGIYGYDYKEMNTLKAFSKKHNLAILLVHHTSKAESPNDPFFTISGTRGLTGALDLMMILRRENAEDKQAKLYIRGRDVDNNAFVIEMKECKWVKVGTLDEIQEQNTVKQFHNNSTVRALNEALKDAEQWRGRMSDLISFAEKREIYISLTPKQLSNEIGVLECQLKKIDGIEHTVINNGKGSSIHVFKKHKKQ